MINVFKNKVTLILSSAVLLIALALSAAMPLSVSARDTTVQQEGSARCGADINIAGTSCPKKTSAGTDINNLIKTVINIFSAVVGAVAVIMIIVGGFRYITSGGDSNNVGAAKNTILYAIVGLVIVAIAQVIVQFVLERTTV